MFVRACSSCVLPRLLLFLAPPSPPLERERLLKWEPKSATPARTGEVVAVGPPKEAEPGAKEAPPPPQVKAGDRVLYFKYAGDKLQTPAGDDYLLLYETDVMGVLPQ